MSNMTNITGQSIAAVSNSVTKNGAKNTVIGAGIFVGVVTICSGIAFYLANKKHKNATNLANTKHTQRMEEIDRRTDQKNG